MKLKLSLSRPSLVPGDIKDVQAVKDKMETFLGLIDNILKKVPSEHEMAQRNWLKHMRACLGLTRGLPYSMEDTIDNLRNLVPIAGLATNQSKIDNREEAQAARAEFITKLVDAIGDSSLDDMAQAFKQKRTEDFSKLVDLFKTKLLDDMKQ